MKENSQEITTAFHILQTGNCVLKALLFLSFQGKNKIMTEIDKSHLSGARICDITITGANL